VVVVSPIASVNPLMAIALAHLFLKRMERITPRIIAGAVLVVAGVTAIAIGAVR
jgi:drug/metabolite transporter (DMT)-like permease